MKEIPEFSKPKSIRDIILFLLRSGPLTRVRVVEEVRKLRASLTKQAIYKTLRLLQAEEIVVIHKGMVSLNAPWVLRMSNYFSLAEHYYLKDQTNTGNFINLKEGERIKYEFQNATATDAFWIHALHILIDAHPQTFWFGYNPHCWFFIARPESERALRDFIKEKGGVYVMTVGGQTFLDRYIIPEFDKRRSKYYMREKPLFPKNNYYVNVIGDFLIEVWIDKKIAQAIEDVYKSTTAYDQSAVEHLKTIIASPGKSKLIITRSRAKTSKLIKTLSRPFVFS